MSRKERIQVIEQIPTNSSDSETSDKDDEVFVNLPGEVDTESESQSDSSAEEEIVQQCKRTKKFRYLSSCQA